MCIILLFFIIFVRVALLHIVLVIGTIYLLVLISYLCCGMCIDDDDFSPTAGKDLEDLIRGCILHCEVTAVEEDGVPYVMLTKVSGTEVIVDYSIL